MPASSLIHAPLSVILRWHLHRPKSLTIHLFHSLLRSTLVACAWIRILFVPLLQLLSLLFFPLEDIGRYELNELVIEDIQDLATDELQLGLLTWQIVVHNLHHCLAQALVIRHAHMHQLLLLLELLREGRLADQLATRSKSATPVILPHRVRLGIPLLAKKGALERERIHDVHLSEDDDPRRGLFALLDGESTVLQLEQIVLLAAEKGDDAQLSVLDAPFLLVVLVGAAVEESILLSRVPVEVRVQDHFAFGVHVPDQELRVVDSRMKEPVGLFPLSVEVTAEQGAPVVAVDDSIWIQHWHNSNDEVFPQLVGLFREQVIDDSVKHVRGLRLARMHPTRDENGLLLSVVLQILVQSRGETGKCRTRGQEMVFIVFKEAFDFLFKSCLQQSLHSPFGLAALSCQFPDFLILLPVLLLDHVRDLVHQLHLLVVVQVRVNVVRDRQQRHRRLAQREAKNVHLQDAAVVGVPPQVLQFLLHVRERVRNRVREVYLVVLVGLELISETKRVIEINAFAGSVVVQ